MRRKKESKKEVWMMGFVAFLMITSIIGFSWKGGSQKVKYNEIPFVQEENGAWSGQILGQKLTLNYHPTELESIEADSEALQRLATVEIDTTYDIDDEYAEGIAKVQYLMEEVLVNYNIFVLRAFTEENEYERPVLTCEDATPFVPIVYFKKSNQKAGQDLLRIKDILIYSALGVMQ
jgi:hypothetical protein